MQHHRAAIDIGSNSTNLLIVDPDHVEVVRETHVTALGERVASSGLLSEAAMERTLQVIERYAAIVQRHGARVQVTGTAACRMASNTPEFFDHVRAITGVAPRLLTPLDEARLAWTGAVTSLPPAVGDTMVIDIGGASTELIIGELSQGGRCTLRESVSLPIGVVSLTEAELHRDPPRAEELSNAISIVGDAVDNAIVEYPTFTQVGRVVGVAGSIVTIAAVEVGMQHFDANRLHGMVLTKDAAEDVFRTLATESLIDRLHNPGLPAERAGVIVAGCCILVALMRRLRLNEIVVSTHNLLDGIVREAPSRDGSKV